MSAFSVATLCRPNSENEKTRQKLTVIEHPKKREKGLRPVGHRSVECHFGLCLQQTVYGGGFLAEGRRQRAVRIAEIAGIARHRRDRETKPNTEAQSHGEQPRSKVKHKNYFIPARISYDRSRAEWS